ncbi:uncharacterized protein MYCFIDRAFT_81596 [Pseudocercospora fijiensis CIRAD86]|uniref:C2H2-type domain-containing protein n=1 Tax=Pseudocercospora fijiensis (strain CIRAD86) TaxID=383855 RepID=M2Z153_PSEFD|nr:uncharacterized protein MYCFIDRAFT_81596 [Pseudocercospora fijiensis CIRAD86]EME83570.1 hypothetical protein MYCFIDRAFT_81596 [Pseudocercospora fijiensis CIRAD86]
MDMGDFALTTNESDKVAGYAFATNAPGNLVDYAPDEWFLGRAITPQDTSTNKPQPPCPICDRIPRNASDADRHMRIHTRPFVCQETGCKITRGFASKNDLERHKKSVHLMMPEAGPKAWYMCPVGGFDKCVQLWPRKDNLRVHMRRQHGADGNQDVIVVDLCNGLG